MYKQRTFFYGLMVGFTLMIFPIPRFFFWKDTMDIVEPVFRYFGFFIFIICSFAILVDLFKIIIKSLIQEIKKI
jgi:hypothetical protein